MALRSPGAYDDWGQLAETDPLAGGRRRDRRLAQAATWTWHRWLHVWVLLNSFEAAGRHCVLLVADLEAESVQGPL